MKNHLKRLPAPKRWEILRKENKYITRPNPGSHSFETGVPVVVLLRDMMKLASNAKEAKYMITKYQLLVDGKKRNDVKFIVGLMDTITMPASNDKYRIILNNSGKIDTIKIEDKEVSIKPCKIMKKVMYKNKIQIGLHDGKNILVDAKNKDYNTGDSLVMEVPSLKVLEHLKLEPKMIVYLVGGKHAGSTGIIENVAQNKITYKTQSGAVFETLKEYAFVVGKTKSSITLPEEKDRK